MCDTILIITRGGGKPSAMDRRMDSFAHGGYDGLDGGDRDASAGKKNTKTQKDKNTKTQRQAAISTSL